MCCEDSSNDATVTTTFQSTQALSLREETDTFEYKLPLHLITIYNPIALLKIVVQEASVPSDMVAGVA